MVGNKEIYNIMRERIKEVYFNENAPIVLFIYNRLEETQKTIESLRNNIGCEKHDLYIFSDAAKSEIEECSVKQLRDYVREINGFKSVNIIERERNFGLAKSIINGVSDIIKIYGRVIVLEDDLVLSSNFLSFMNQSLSYYRSDKRILNVSGFSYKDSVAENESVDVFLWGRATSWGWGTWADRWKDVDWDMELSEIVKNKKLMQEFSKYGYDLPVMLEKQSKGLINSWAIRWCYHQFRNNMLSVVPVKSKVINNGFGGEATHCKLERNIIVDFDNQGDKKFQFEESIDVKPSIYKSYKYHYSRTKRIFERIKGLFN